VKITAKNEKLYTIHRRQAGNSKKLCQLNISASIVFRTTEAYEGCSSKAIGVVLMQTLLPN